MSRRRLAPPSLLPFGDERVEESVVAPLPAAVPAEELPLAIREVLGFRASLLPHLPAACWLVCGSDLTTDRVLLASHQEAEAAFYGAEVLALLAAAENDRANPDVIAAWWARKQKDPGWRLTSIEALAGVARGPALGFTVEQMLRPFGLRLEGVRV